MFDSLAVTAVGLLAQACFSARTIIQWVVSERAKRVLSPALFWVFSAAGAMLMSLYGVLRQDFAIVLGQSISYYVYLWNLRIKRVPIPRFVMCVLMFVPVAAAVAAGCDVQQFIGDFFLRPELPLWLLVFGTVGQLLFTFRFIYQWWYSSRIGESQLPPLFWWISITATIIVLVYGLIRQDFVLILGQTFGFFVYGRNLWIGRKQPTEN